MATSLKTAPEARARGLTETVVSFVVDTPFTKVPAAAIANAKTIVLDTFGVSFAAAPHAVGRIISRYAVDAGGKATATILGAGTKAAVPMAALANGTLANALDFNESSHIATHTLPAVLALAEDGRRSGRDLLDAFVIGFEAGSRIAQAFDGARTRDSGPTYRGWWHVGVIAPIASAIAAARLLRLDRRQTAMAIGIATCGAGGFRRNMGTMAKPLHSGNGARNGIEAALLASRGFTADPEILEAPLGFLAALCNPDERDEAAIGERLGRGYVLEGPPRIKPFPSCTRAHKGIDAALAIRAQASFAPEEVESIEADFQLFSLLRPEAPDEDAAGFSNPFLISAALVYGAVGLDQISAEALADRRVRALMARARHVDTHGKEKVTVRLRDGRVLSQEIDKHRHLADKKEIEAKYAACAGRALPPEAAADVGTMIAGLEELPDLDALMSLAAGPPRS